MKKYWEKITKNTEATLTSILTFERLSFQTEPRRKITGDGLIWKWLISFLNSVLFRFSPISVWVCFFAFLSQYLPTSTTLYQDSRSKYSYWLHCYQHTKSLKMSRWWTWMVMSVSYLVRSILVRSCSVMSIRRFSISKNAWLVAAMIFLSERALVRAYWASRVQIIWMPRIPTWSTKKAKKVKESRCSGWDAEVWWEWQIWLRCHHMWHLFCLGATITGSNPAARLFLLSRKKGKNIRWFSSLAALAHE